MTYFEATLLFILYFKYVTKLRKQEFLISVLPRSEDAWRLASALQARRKYSVAPQDMMLCKVRDVMRLKPLLAKYLDPPKHTHQLYSNLSGVFG